MAGSGCSDTEPSTGAVGAARLRPGRVVLIVGPSGAGKDAIIGVVRARLAQDQRFLFPSRIVTRAPSAAEQNDTVSSEEFEALVARGALALHWSAHGLNYGLPSAVDTAVQEGCTVVFNASRQIIPAAKARYTCTVVYIDAPLHTRAERLAARSRERADDIAARLARKVSSFAPSEADLLIDNSGPLADAAERLAGWLLSQNRADA